MIEGKIEFHIEFEVKYGYKEITKATYVKEE